MSKWIEIDRTSTARRVIDVGCRVKMIDYDDYSSTVHRATVTVVVDRMGPSFETSGPCGYDDCDRETHRYYYDQVIAVKPPKRTAKATKSHGKLRSTNV